MTFSCKNHDFATDICKKLKSRCIMGRPGCVLEGKVNVSQVNLYLINELAKEKARKRKRKSWEK